MARLVGVGWATISYSQHTDLLLFICCYLLLPVYWDHLRVQRSVTSMGELYFFFFTFEA